VATPDLTTSPGGRHALAAATVAASAAALIRRYEDTWRSLTGSVDRIRATFPREAPAVRRRRAAAFAAQAVAALDQLDAETDTLTGEAVRAVAGTVAVVHVADLGRQLTARRALLDAAVRDLAADLRAAASYTLSTARALSRAVQRLAAADGPAASQEAALERVLRDRGLAAVVYRDGSRHGLAEYARMAVRTKLAETWQLASFDLYRQAGVQYVEVSDGAGCGWTSHSDPDKANGSIRTLDEAGAYPLAHPNCARSSFPRLDVRTDDDARSARPLSSTLIPDTVSEGDRAPAVRVAGGRLDTRALAVLAPAAARHAQTLARVAARNVAAEGDRAGLHAGTRRATVRTPRTPTPGPGGAP
jgi:hypothetical protein